LGYSESIPLTGDFTTDQLQIEFISFRISHRRREGGMDKFGHFKNIVDLLWNNPDRPSMKRFIWNPPAEKMLRECCECQELGIAGPTSLGKSDPAALWMVVNYIADATHVKGLVMSSTLDGAKLRIWKTLREYINALPDIPGKQLWSTNRILGPNYEGDGTGESSGIMLLASEKSREKDALEKMIGIKSPRTGEPTTDFEVLKANPEFADLANHYDDDTLRDILPRLANLTDDRMGKLILIVDEATGLAESLLTAINSNMKPGNINSLQIIMLGNPALHWDSFGQFCEPAIGWDKITLQDFEWETKTGGKCIRFNGEDNPRIKEPNERYSWMLTQKQIDDIAKEFGTESLYYWRMVRGAWSPKGSESGVYSQADVESNGSMGKATWGFEKPSKHSTLDPSFSSGGDKAMCTFSLYGRDPEGLQTVEIIEQIPIKVNIADTETPVNYQIVRQWRDECKKRGIPPENAAFDGTGGGLVFGDIVITQWSRAVQLISSAGSASSLPINEKGPDGKQLLAKDRFANKATEVWYGLHPFLRSGQVRGITPELAKEICLRQHDKSVATNGRVLKIENKRLFKSREGFSPDNSDSALLTIEHLKTRHGFKPAERAAVAVQSNSRSVGTWASFCAKARKAFSKPKL
jgi:hypothetical protein